MVLRYYGHSMFLLSLENGYRILTDPYGDFYQYPKRVLHADLVTVSHHHHDHDAIDMVEGDKTVLDKAGIFHPGAGVTVRGIPCWHDEVRGAKRGSNLIFLIEAEGLRIAHLGDLGHVLDAAQARAAAVPDVLLVPVGGTYTTDAIAAAKNVALLRPKVTIPMHYQTRFNAEMPITDETPFLALMGVKPEPMQLLRLTKGDLSERPPVLLMQVTAPDETAR
jgi:L-ascorbate metabolism protein UlaG (beta-lactamase superfamily)